MRMATRMMIAAAIDNEDWESAAEVAAQVTPL